MPRSAYHVFQVCETLDLNAEQVHVLFLSRPVICEEVQALLSSIHEDGAATSSMDGDNNLTIRYRLQKCTNNIISRMTLGKTMDELTTSKEHSKSFIDSLIKSIEYMGMLNIGDYIPSLAWMDLQVSIFISMNISQDSVTCNELQFLVLIVIVINMNVSEDRVL